MVPSIYWYARCRFISRTLKGKTLINPDTKIIGPLGIIILDGWGVSEDQAANAVLLADTPNLDGFKKEYPYTFLACSGSAVGLPEGQMGNSEVGHLNIGAGRVVYQDLTRISRAILDRSFFSNEALMAAMKSSLDKGGAVHLMGLVSDGGVHSSDEHYLALIDLALGCGVKDLYFHAFLDGRDVPPKSAIKYIRVLEEKLRKCGFPGAATISGRYYAMDRDNRWDRISKAYDALVYRKGIIAESAENAIDQGYRRGEVDEFIQPTVIKNGAPGISSKDSVIFFNFRADRTRELTRTLIQKDFKEFDRGAEPPFPYMVSMTEYDEEFDIPVAFPTIEIRDTLADVLAAHHLKQLHIAETEKYAHVTFFFNGGVEEPKEGEDRILIPSPKVPTYDLKPEMSAFEVAEAAVKEIESDKYDVIILNFANCDMVGHTGILDAAIKAVEAVDKAVGEVVRAITQRQGECFILADHGNAEQMVEPDSGGKPHTAHTLNRVPFIYITNSKEGLRAEGALCDVAPTALEILGIDKPALMTGSSLIIAKHDYC